MSLLRRHRVSQIDELKEFVAHDLAALSAVVNEVEAAAARTYDGDAKANAQRARVCLDAAEDLCRRAERPADIEPVTNAIGNGRYSAECARARLDGHEPPPRRAPCFFDPSHGSSARDVAWAPDGATSGTVPACAADAARLESGSAPVPREVVVRGRTIPYWDAPWYYGGWAGGYFAEFGGGAVLPGALFGGWLGSGLGWEAITGKGLDHRGHDGPPWYGQTGTVGFPPRSFGGPR
jgi:hypothetical protein